MSALLVAAVATPALAQTSVTRSPSAAASVTASGGSGSWSNLTNVYASSNNRTETSPSSGNTSHFLRVTGNGFSIPTNATILGVTVGIERYATGTSVQERELRLLRAGSPVGSDKASANNWPSSTSSAEAIATYGGAADLWGDTWTPAQINASTFGVSFRVNNGSGGSRTAYVDHVSVTVTYILPPSAAHSTLSVDRSSIFDDGTSVATATVQLKDAAGHNTTATTETVTLATTIGTVTASGGSPSGASVVLSSAGGGTYTGTLTSTTAGAATLTASLNAATIGTAPVTVLQPPDAAYSTITANPATRLANWASKSTITVQLKNASGGDVPVSGGTVLLTTTRGTLSAVTDHDNGTYTATLASTSPGSATVRGYLDGTELGSVATVTFEPIVSFDINYKPIDLSAMTLRSGTALAVNAVYQKLGAITIDGQVLDARITIVDRSNVTSFVFDNDTTNPGRFEPEINSSSTSGGYVDLKLSFFLSGTDTKVDIRNFFITAVDVDGASASVREYLEIRDYSSYLLDTSTMIVVETGVRPGFTRFLGRTTSLAGIVFDNTAALIARYDIPLSDIEFRLGYSGSSSATRLHSLEFGAEGGTFSNPDTQVPLITGPSNGPGAATSAKSVPENTTPVHTFTANKPVNWTLNGGADEAKFTLDPLTGALAFIAAPDYENPTDADGNNTYVVVVRASDANGWGGDQTVTVTVTDVIAGDPARYIVTSSEYAPMAGSDVTVTAQLADANDAPLAMAGMTVTWSKSDASGAFTSATSTTDADGKATVVLTTAPLAGTATTVTASTGAITGTSSTITTEAGAISMAPTGTQLSGADLSRVADGVQAATITLQLRDEHGSAVTRSGVAVTFATTAGTLSATSATTDAAGTAVVTLTSTSLGQADVTATVDDDDEAGTAQVAVSHGSPVTVQFATGPISVAPAGSLMTGADLVRVADGTSAATVSVQLKDAQGRDLAEADVAVTFASTRGTLSSTAAVMTDEAGTASVTLTSTQAGAAVVTASIAGSGLGAVTHGSPVTVTFTPGAASPATSLITATPDEIAADGVSTSTVRVQLKDAHGNDLATSGGTVALATTQGTLGAVTDEQDGTYTAILTSPTAVGQATVTGTLESAAIAGDATVTFVPGAASGATSTIAAVPTTIAADGTATSAMTVRLKDAHGNDLTASGGTVVLATTHGSLGTVTDHGDGSYSATLTAGTVVAVAAITGTIAGDPIAAKATVVFEAGPISVASGGSRLSGTDLTRPADGTSAATVSVQLRDAYGNDVAEAGVAVTFSTTRGTLSSSAPVMTDESGVATVTLTSTQTGTAEVTASVAGSGLGAVTNGSPVTVTFVAGAAAVATSTIEAAPGAMTADGLTTSTVTVRLRDVHGNDLTGSGGDVAIATTRGTLGAVTDRGDGTYTATLTSSTTVGTAIITGTLDGADIEDDAEVRFTPGAASALASTIAASPVTLTADGASTSLVTVRLKDAHGNDLEASGGTLVLATTRGALGTGTDHHDGTYSAVLTSSTTVGVATITGTLNSVLLTGDATVTFTEGTASSTASTIEASPVSIAADGTSTSTITVRLKDAHGNALTASGGTVTLATTRGTLGPVTDHQDGSYTATLTSAPTVGTAAVTAALDGTTLAGDASVAFVPGPASLVTSTIVASPVSVTADGLSTSVLTVRLKDAQGNDLAASGGTVTLATTHGTLGTVTDHLDGHYTVVLTSGTVAVKAAITAALDGAALQQEAAVAFVVGPASPSTTTIEAAPVTIAADGTSTATVTVRLVDAHGNALTASGGTVVIAASYGTVSAVTDHLDGTYTATLTSSTTVQKAAVTATLNSAAIDDKTAVDFVAGAASSDTSTIGASPTTVTADGTSTSTITVQLKDAHGNDLTVGGGTVVLATTRGSLGSVTDHGDGSYSATLTASTVAGQAIVTATLGGTPLANDARVDFVPGPAAAATSTLAAHPTAIVANGTSISTITVQLKDEHGNNLTQSGGTVVIATTHGTVGTVVDNGDGTYTVTLTSAPTEGTATITATLDSATLSGKAEVEMGPRTTLELTKTAGSGLLVRGGSGAFVLTVRNSGGAATDGTVMVVDTVPDGLVPVQATGAGWGPHVNACAIVDRTVTCTRADALAAGNSFAAITIEVDVASDAGTPLVNTATVSGGGAAGGAGSVSVDTAMAPDMTVTKSHQGAFTRGGIGTYTIRVRNAGGSATSASVSVADSLPAGLTALTLGGEGWSCDTSSLTCTRADALAAGQAYPDVTLTVRIATGAPASVTNVATVSGGGETNTGNNTDADVADIETPDLPDLTISKSHRGVFLRGQHDLAYTLVVANAGGGPTWEPVTVVDTLPDGLVATTAAGAGWSCGIAGQTVTCERADVLAPGAAYPAIVLGVTVAAHAPAEVTNVAVVSGGGIDATLVNNSASDVTVVRSFDSSSMELDLQKRADRPRLRVGDRVIFDIDVENIGGSRMDDVQLRDTLPHGFQFVPGTAQVLRAEGGNGRSGASPQVSSLTALSASGATAAATAPAEGWQSVDPQGANAELTFALGQLHTGAMATVRYTALVTPSAQPGANLTRVIASTAGPDGELVSSVPVEVAVIVEELSFSSSRVLVGRVFEDVNGNGQLDPGEPGIGGVRVLMATGQSATTDARGMYSFPIVSAGTKVVALDPATVPAGYAIPRGNALSEGPSRLLRTPFSDFGMLRQNFPLTRSAAGAGAAALFAGTAPADVAAQVPASAQAPAGGRDLTVAAFEIQPERRVLTADGRDRTEVRVRAVDAEGRPVMGGLVTLTASQGYVWVPQERVASAVRTPVDVCAFLEPEPGTETADQYRRTVIDLAQGDRVCLVADVNPGLVVLTARQDAAIGAAAGDATVELTALNRAPVIVAIGEVTISQRMPEATLDESPSRVQRLGSFFFQDSFGENGLVTVAGTSARSINQETGADRLFGRDPLDRIYPVLGDASTRLELAQSNAQWYGRMDLGRSHVMFGDLRGDVADGRSRIIEFQRSLTGARAYVANGQQGWTSIAISSPDTTFARDVFPGTSGAYLRLDRGNVVTGSEIVTLEVRDRRSPERVLSREPLVRSADYHLEPLAGIVYLLRPLPALTSALDLVQVVVTYEARAAGPGSDVILARTDQRIEPIGLAVRASGLRQRGEFGSGLLTVGGVEAEQRLPVGGRLRVELPVSRIRAEGPGSPSETGFAARLDLSQPIGYRNGVVRGRFARTERAFDNPFGQQIVPGQTSGEAALELTPLAGSQLRASVGHEVNETALVDNSRTTAGAEWAQRLGEQLRLTGAFTARRFDDELADRRVRSQMATGAIDWRMSQRLETTLRREQNLGSEADPTYPTQTVFGGRYHLNRLHAIFATQRISSAPIVPASDTAAAGIFTPLSTREFTAGVESRLNQYTSVLSRYRRETMREGTDAFAVIGLLTRVPVSRTLAVDAGVDHAHHIEGEGRSYSSGSAGLTYVPHEDVRASWFYQVRLREERQHVLWTGVTGRILPWLTGLGQYRWLRAEGRGAGEGVEGLGAVAIRPVESDRAGLLFSYDYGDFVTAHLPGARRRTGRLSSDAFYQPMERLELFTRLARVDAPAQDGLASQRTYLWQGRGQYRLFSRFDVAGETRHLSPIGGAGTWVAAGETGVWVSRDLRVGLGYASRPMMDPGQAVTLASGRGGGYLVLSTRLASLFDLGGRLAGERSAAAGR